MNVGSSELFRYVVGICAIVGAATILSNIPTPFSTILSRAFILAIGVFIVGITAVVVGYWGYRGISEIDSGDIFYGFGWLIAAGFMGLTTFSLVWFVIFPPKPS
jgi:hypothetical protein